MAPAHSLVDVDDKDFDIHDGAQSHTYGAGEVFQVTLFCNDHVTDASGSGQVVVP